MDLESEDCEDEDAAHHLQGRVSKKERMRCLQSEEGLNFLLINSG